MITPGKCPVYSDVRGKNLDVNNGKDLVSYFNDVLKRINTIQINTLEQDVYRAPEVLLDSPIWGHMTSLLQ